MEKIPVFDARICYGRGYLGKEPEISLADAMVEAEAERAVFVSNELAWLPPEKSNDLVNARTASTPGAWGLYLMLSALPGEQPEANELIRTFRKNRIAGFYFHPSEYGVPQDPIMFRDELTACEQRRVPVFYHKDTANSYEYLCRILEKHPALRVVLSAAEEWPNARKIYPLMKAYPGISLCISENVWMGAIDDIARLFGAERMLYSSSYPSRYPGGSVMMVQNARISQREKDLIFRGNMERLTEEMCCD